jgi:cell wall-associated NlpC family hydrolase
MGVAWTFPNGETAPAAGSQWEGNLDCSGFVRMIYGYHLGIPMVVSANYNSLNLPRVTENIGRSGPGVVVADGGSSVPSLTGLQIGDVVHFDADSSDPGVIDHNGIFMGADSNGYLRFVNSRKTPHGPTFADLGGNSRLDGTGTYATTLRLIRRF